MNRYLNGFNLNYQIDLLGVSNNTLHEKVENYNTINTNLINNLTITSNNSITDLNNFKNTVGVSSIIYDNKIHNLTTTSKNNSINNFNSFKNLVGVSFTDTRITTNFYKVKLIV